MASQRCFVLFAFKCDPTFDGLSFIFALERGRAKRSVQRWQGLLETALGKKRVLPERKLARMAHFRERLPAVKAVLFAGTERPVPRPQDSAKQKAPYAGKKKRQTRKHSTGSTRKKRVLIWTQAQPGKVHAKRSLDEAD